MMQLNFEHSQEVCDGHEPAAFHYRDQNMLVMFNNSADTLQYVTAVAPESQFGNLDFSEPENAIRQEDPSVTHHRSYSYSGIEHWITWLKNPAHRIAKYKYKLHFPLIAFQVREEELIRLEWQEPYWDTVEDEPA